MFLSSSFALLAGPLVTGTGFDQPAEWRRKPFCGTDFFLMLSMHGWSDISCTTVPEGYSVYRECGLRIEPRELDGMNDLVAPTKRWNGDAQLGYARLLAEAERRKEPYRLWDQLARRYGKKCADALYGDAWTNRPFLFMSGGERPAFRLNKTYPLADRADHAAFLKGHPNYLGNYAMSEFDSDLATYFSLFPVTKDRAALGRLEEAYPCTFKDWAWNTDIFDEWVAEAKRRCVEYFYGDDRLWGFTSGTPGIVPLYAREGFKGVCYEATTQGGGASWRFAGAQLRGAARQFGMGYGWYTASYYSGYRRDAKPTDRITSGENSLVGPIKGYAFFGLNRGASFSIIERQNVYGWLIGARYVEVENWGTYHMKKVERKEKGKGEGEERTLVEYVPSSAAQDFEDLHRMAKREDRGLVYAPLALCFPIHEKIQNNGDQIYFTGFRQSAPLLTLVPGCPIRDFRRKGIEGGFYNSEFGDFFDIITPDATNDVEKTLAALRPYKAAAVFGHYRLPNVNPVAFTRYAEEGGTLFVSEDYVREGIVEERAAGVAFGEDVVAAGRELVDDRGVRAPLKGSYVLRKGAPTTASAFWHDENGNVVAYVNRLGKGRVVTVTVDGMLPFGWTRVWGIPDPARHTADFGRLFRGEVTFEILRAVFRRVQEETMPFRVAGDIHWGVNKIEVKGKGEGEDKSNNQTIKQSNNSSRRWLVWLFNNRGVTNYLDEEPVVDRACDAKVTVTGALGVKIASVRSIRMDADAQDKSNNLQISKSNNSFSVTVPAGGWAAFEVVEN